MATRSIMISLVITIMAISAFAGGTKEMETYRGRLGRGKETTD